MPGYDGTGPAGAGPMSGRGRGSCAPQEPSQAGGWTRRRSLRRGMGRFCRFGGGFGWNRGFRSGGFMRGGITPFSNEPVTANASPHQSPQDRDALRAQLGTIEQHLARIREQLDASEDR